MDGGNGCWSPISLAFDTGGDGLPDAGGFNSLDTDRPWGINGVLDRFVRGLGGGIRVSFCVEIETKDMGYC